MQVGKIDEESLEYFVSSEKSPSFSIFKNSLHFAAGLLLLVAVIYGFFSIYLFANTVSNVFELDQEIFKPIENVLDIKLEPACCLKYNLEILGTVEGYRHGYLVIR